MSQVELVIPKPPDILFSKERTGHILNETQPIYLIEKMEAREGYGIAIKYKNVPYVKKGFPTPEAIFAINQVKKLILETAKHLKNPIVLLAFLTVNKTKLCQSFNVVFDKLFGTHKLKEEFMCRAAFNLGNFIQGVMIDLGVDHDTAKEFGFNLAQIIEYDDSYRYRFQDVMTEMNLDLFKKNPKKELERMMGIFTERTENLVINKVKSVTSLIILLAPFIKKSLIKNASFLKQAELDKDDRYWVCMREDQYNYLGLSSKQRHELYKERPIAYQATA